MSDNVDFEPQSEELFGKEVYANHMRTVDVLKELTPKAVRTGQKYGDIMSDMISDMAKRAVRDAVPGISDEEIEDSDAYMELTIALAQDCVEGINDTWFYALDMQQ